MTRMIRDPGTRGYVTRRTEEGRSYREIRRSLKRYIARTLYRQLNALYTAAESAPSHVAGADGSDGVRAPTQLMPQHPETEENKIG